MDLSSGPRPILNQSGFGSRVHRNSCMTWPKNYTIGLMKATSNWATLGQSNPLSFISCFRSLLNAKGSFDAGRSARLL
ncbi:hypothetical protein F0562_015778 [Nyssa sinensis]|uniref:Uncharacterized protein n=1 Tax=Nyssa sinensis TaxID=561372 RepID=A0A5J4ZJW7_9ASTE|nr:hypothetical protein F0562_015778 [Nyssa sinensis]